MSQRRRRRAVVFRTAAWIGASNGAVVAYTFVEWTWGTLLAFCVTLLSWLLLGYLLDPCFTTWVPDLKDRHGPKTGAQLTPDRRSRD